MHADCKRASIFLAPGFPPAPTVGALGTGMTAFEKECRRRGRLFMLK